MIGYVSLLLEQALKTNQHSTLINFNPTILSGDALAIVGTREGTIDVTMLNAAKECTKHCSFATTLWRPKFRWYGNLRMRGTIGMVGRYG
jgi:hypothetical protein